MAADDRDNPIVSIGIAISTSRRPDALARCLRSLAAGRALPAEVVVVDQSDDGSADSVVAAAAGLPAVRHVHQHATGLGVAQNEAVARTTTPVVAVLDDDCVADPGWIAELHRALGPGGHADVVGGRVLPLEEGGKGLEPVSSRRSRVAREVRHRRRPWEVGSGNNFAFRREWFERLGGCDVRLGPGAPGRGAVDIDLFYRLLRAGARVRYEPRAVVYHERKTRAERLTRRVPYGFGMGAACVKWLRERDLCAIRVFAAWLALRVRLLVRGVVTGRWSAVREELLVLGGTLLGVVHGFRVLGPAR